MKKTKITLFAVLLLLICAFSVSAQSVKTVLFSYTETVHGGKTVEVSRGRSVFTINSRLLTVTINGTVFDIADMDEKKTKEGWDSFTLKLIERGEYNRYTAVMLMQYGYVDYLFLFATNDDYLIFKR